eukprot:scaffold2312_cov165-Ochromonas_danica.AAC.85
MLRRTAGLMKSCQAYSTRRPYVSANDLFGEEEPEVLTVENSKTVRSFQAYPINKKINGRFVSIYNKDTNKSLWDVLRLLFSTPKQHLKLPGVADSKELIKRIIPDRAKIRSTSSPHATWFGHATCYFQSGGTYFLTDPVWGQRASPLSFIGPKRFSPSPIEIEDLKIDVVLLSHTHYDHMDVESVKRIGNRALVVPLGVGAILKSMGVTNWVELDWWGSYNYLAKDGNNIEVMFVPTKHWTSRTPFDKNTCLWGGYAVFTPEAKFFFCGDTAYASVFKLIGDNLGPFDFAAVPIGAYSPRWFMKNVHCNPEEAVKIHEDLRAKQSMAIHWGTFPMTSEDPVEPALELARLRDLRNINTSDFFTMAQGETIILGEEPQYDFATLYKEHYDHYLDNLRKVN